MTVTTFSAECAAASLPHAGLPARPARDILLAEMADPAFEEVIGNRATPAGLKAFRERHEAWSDARIDERIGDGRLINEERQILFDILAQRRHKAAGVARIGAIVSAIGAAAAIIAAVAALISAWFAWHPPH